MAPKRQVSDPNTEVPNLLRKLLALQLSAMGVSQGSIAKKLKMNLNTVNNFLKGTKKETIKKEKKSE